MPDKSSGDKSGAQSPPPDWGSLLGVGALTVESPVATDYVATLGGASSTFKMRVEGGALWAVKSVDNMYGDGHAIFAEQVVPLLGGLIGAPVPTVGQVDLPADLITASALTIAGTGTTPTAGLQHASAWVDGYGDRLAIDHVDQNRESLAAASVLYTWTRASDCQLIYQLQEPHAVLSVDHGAFFADQGQWDASSLPTFPLPTQYDAFFDPAGLSDIDRSASLDLLETIKPESIATAVAAPPDSWHVSPAERLALCEFLWARRAAVLSISGRVGQ